MQKTTLLTVIALGSAFAPLVAKKQTLPSKPNIVFILADDFSYRDLSVYGQTRFNTPNLDMLATEGIRFTQAYSAAPECAPSRCALMTGLHCGHSTVRLNDAIDGQHPLRDEDITVAEVLKTAGYKTAFVGKWGIGLPGSTGVPYKQGFDLAFGFYDQLRAHTFFPNYLYENEQKIVYPGNYNFDMNRMYRTVSVECAPEDYNVYNSEGKLTPREVDDYTKMVYSEHEIQQRAIRFITENSSNPFFLYFATPLPHGPIIVDHLGELTNRTDFPDQRQKEWAAMVLTIDKFVGDLVEHLKALGIYENTILFFASDNGYSMHRYIRRNAPQDWSDDPYLENKGSFNGGKFSAQEGGVRIPFFIHWKGVTQPAVYSEPVWLADFFNTAAELAGVKQKHETDGISLVPFISNRPQLFAGHSFMYWYKNNEQAVRIGPWRAYRKNPKVKTELYLIEEDTYCERNLAHLYPGIVAEAEAIMAREHTPSDFYFNPGDDVQEFRNKIAKEKAEGRYNNGVTGNSVR